MRIDYSEERQDWNDHRNQMTDTCLVSSRERGSRSMSGVIFERVVKGRAETVQSSSKFLGPRGIPPSEVGTRILGFTWNSEDATLLERRADYAPKFC